jgi:PPOX class probable F420-dependent enzyme
MSTDPIAMTRDQMEQFLAKPRNAVMGTVRRNGSPQLSTIWFLYRNGKVYCCMHNSSAKYFNIQRDPRVVICVPGAHPDARSVTIYGTAELIPSNTDMYLRLERELAYRYHESPEEAEAYLDDYDGENASVAVVTPAKLIGEDYN